MIVDNEPFLIEYNVRMGDPECQTILPRMESDLLEIILACCNQTLDKTNIKWSDKKSLCIVLCSKGYPESYKKNINIPNLKNLIPEKNNFIYHAGTKISDDKILASGGRVLNFVSLSNDFKLAKKNIENNLTKLNWTGGFFRRDIGYKVIE